ncbi:MAG: T9SS type A sorting domain-containing protein, partial [Bacteroidetes bacterium]|nr:T9SS type A sorting domain-containing protein [Bacteroidota bacterium]
SVEFVRIMDTQGRILFQSNIGSVETFALDINTWATGLYLVEINSSEQRWVKTIEKR